MTTKKPTVSIYLEEATLCRHFRLKKIVTARWIGTPGNRKIVIVGERSP